MVLGFNHQPQSYVLEGKKSGDTVPGPGPCNTLQNNHVTAAGRTTLHYSLPHSPGRAAMGRKNRSLQGGDSLQGRYQTGRKEKSPSLDREH